MSELEQRQHAILRAQELVAVNIPVSAIENEGLPHQSWWYKIMNDRDVWVSKTCSRVLLVTSREHWDEIAAKHSEFTVRCMQQDIADKRMEVGNPDPFTLPKPYFIRKDGWDAYTYLLELSCGLHSSEPGEEHISHQILDESYQQHKQSKYNNGKCWLDPIVKELQHDMRQVRRIISEHIPPTVEDTALETLALKPGSNVLLVTDRWQHTEPMLYALARHTKTRPRAIDIAHIFPQNGSIDNLQLQINKLLQKRDNWPPINSYKLDDIVSMGQEWLKDYQAVIIVSELNCYLSQERELIDIWKNCSPQKPKLAAIRFDRSYEGEIMPHAELKEQPQAIVLLPDKIEESFLARQKRYKDIMAQGKQACQLCTQLHQHYNGSHHPRGEWLHLGFDGYLAQHEAKRFCSRLSPSCQDMEGKGDGSSLAR